MTFKDYKNQLLEYLKREKEFTEDDIQNHKDLPEDDQVEQGYLVPDCHITKKVDDCYELTTQENNSKLRAGDRVVLTRNGSNTKIKATIVENFFNQISITTSAALDMSYTYDIHVTEAVLLDPLINLFEGLEDGASGSFYIKELGQLEQPNKNGYGAIDVSKTTLPTNMNEAQRTAVEKVFSRPSIYCIQGPPGTGKTDVLSTIARAFSEQGREVLIVSNTHQAVNNALNKIAKNQSLPVVKIGEALKAQELSGNIQLAKSYSDYLKTRPKRRNMNAKGTIIGMTLHAAIINLGLRNSGFSPSVVLADEAGQIPLTYGAAIGTFGAGSIVFIGDDRQMPPIFHPQLTDDEMSVSIFTHLTNLYPDYKTVLDTTYRMNTEITEFVSKHFYEPYGISLKAIRQPSMSPSIEFIINSQTDGGTWKEYNPKEAQIAAEKALEYARNGFEVAIVTPFRKQVNCLREAVTKEFNKNGIPSIPIVDTVERLQGQDVDVIIISFSISDIDYYKQIVTFVIDPHRLNVMLSRAKEKVLILKSDFIRF